MEKSLEVLPRLLQVHAKRARESVRTQTKSKRTRLTWKAEPTGLAPQLLDHRSVPKANCKFPRSKTGIPILGKLTINDLRMLKELHDSFCLMYDLAIYATEARFVKDSFAFIEHLLSSRRDFYCSWFIRRMKTQIWIRLRQLRCRKPSNGGGSHLCDEEDSLNSPGRRSLTFKPKLPRDFGYRYV